MSEHEHQVALIQWRDWHVARWPILEFLFAIPNGGARPWKVDDEGRRYSPEAERLRQEGVQAGVLDLQLPVARNGYVGLWIEMKYGRNKVTPDQQRWIDFLRSENHRVEVCYDWAAAAAVVVDYLDLDYDALPAGGYVEHKAKLLESPDSI